MDNEARNYSGSGAAKRRIDNLAMAYQEVFTVIVRLRGNRQRVDDPTAFRSQILAGLKTAEEEARAKGYSAEDIRVASFAVVGLLDESILNSRNPAFGEWLRRPLQQELYGVQIAGEIFFRNIERLLTRADSQELADLLEVYALCLSLGFRGRHSVEEAASLRAITASLTERIGRIRGSSWPVMPQWKPHSENAPVKGRDTNLRSYAWVAAAIWIIAVALFVLYKLVLGSLVSGSSNVAAAARF